MGFHGRFGQVGLAIAGLAFTASCGGGEADGPVLRSDAEFNPPSEATAFRPISEANQSVAQTFTVGQDGRLEEFWLVITDGESTDDGTIQITVQPVDGGGVIDDDVSNSIIDPILIDTATLPAVLVEEFTEFDIGGEPGRDVGVGERYAIVVDFMNRDSNNDTGPIARVLGQIADPADPYADGTGATGQLNVGFTNNTEDYFFRTFVLD